MLRILAGIQGTPLEQLALSIESLSEILNVSFVSVSVFSNEPVLSSTAVAATPGFAAAAQHGIPVTIEQADGSAPTSMHCILEGQEYLEACSPLAAYAAGRANTAELEAACAKLEPDQQGAYLSPLPPDWQALSSSTGLHAFAAVPIVHAGMIVGMLTVGDEQELGSYASGGLSHTLQVAATWMSQWLGAGGGMLPGLASMLSSIASAGDMEALVSAVCTGLQEYFKKRMQIKLRVRVALLDSPDSAVVYEEQVAHSTNTGLHHESKSDESEVLPMKDRSGSFSGCKAEHSPRHSTDIHSRLRCLHKSAAVASLDDVKHVTQNISANEEIREQLNAASTELFPAMPSPSQPKSHPLYNASGLTPAKSHPAHLPLGSSLSSASSLGQQPGATGQAPSIARVGSSSVHGSSAGSNTRRSPSLTPVLSSPAIPGSLASRGSMGHMPDAALATMPPHAPQVTSPLSSKTGHVPQRPSSLSPFSSRDASQHGNRNFGPDLIGSVLTSSKSRERSSPEPTNVGSREHLPGMLPRSCSVNSGAMTEDILLQMVQEADEQDRLVWHLVAHTMFSLERTVLANVLTKKNNEGTWIKDVTLYMTQPNRPGRDIVLSAKSPPVASLVLCCLPPPLSSCPSTGETACGNNSSNDATPFASLSSSAFSSQQQKMLSREVQQQQQQKEQQEEQPRQQVPMAVYLVSPTSLVPLQLQAVLRELQLVLGFMSPAVSMHMHGELREEWLRAREGMVHSKPSGPPPSLSTGLGSSSRLSQATNPAKQVPAPFSKPLGWDRLIRPSCATPPPILPALPDEVEAINATSSSAAQVTPILDADQLDSSHFSMPASPAGSVHGGRGFAFPRRSTFKRSLTHYSRAQETPQVAPLVASLQAQLCHQMANQHHMELFNDHKDLGSLRACQLIAEGGFSSVYKGLWQGLEVAIKIVPQRKEHSDSVREAVELAVMSTVSHPNMLGIQNFWVDVIVTPHSRSLACDKGNGLVKLESGMTSEQQCIGDAATLQLNRKRAENPFDKTALCLVIVMELSDQGSLDKAIHEGCFWMMPAPGRPPCLNMVSILTTLLEIAMALRHMHIMQLVHCDLKPGNVLLKSSRTDSRRFTTKLCDFGLVKFRHEVTDLTEQVRRSTFTGTVTHSPPEMLQGDPNPDYAYDVYAFGILMYEMCSLTPVYAGLSDRQVAQQVVYNHLRPTFSRRVPIEYVNLAKQCWAADPKERPTMSQVVRAISKMLMCLRDVPPSPPWSPPPLAQTHMAPLFPCGQTAAPVSHHHGHGLPPAFLQQGPKFAAPSMSSNDKPDAGLYGPTPVLAHMPSPR